MAAQPDGHRQLADFIPQSMVRATTYGLQIATYPAGRFVDPRTFRRDRRASLPVTIATRPVADVPLAFRIAVAATMVVCVIASFCLIPLLIK